MNPDDSNDDLEIVPDAELHKEFGTMASLNTYTAQNVAAFVSELTSRTIGQGVGTHALVARCAAAYTQGLLNYWTERVSKDDPVFYEFTEE